ncbi:unnamed protein product [Kuraishia capsulata CBS 1993]|uniref:Transcription factor CBF/NF-Y/archaeal histone domain-containing protein n=1 Tax=Kuraishia capsulata CBS 1993 TaxID=1382522 RepID=W6MKQ9_9ASCO|nr:uncharacterized protein KUCA_T00002586001 [Kuraishia capsulata CBS 1993]CDK26613.1 unnamed protein product [Kuraishia capsulata CBS 1993]
MSQEESIALEDDQTVPESTLTLPISRIKKIMKLDPDHVTSTEGAVYLVGVATELFILYLAEQAAFVAKANQRKKVTYKDFHSAISNKENLNFLGDIAPPVYSLKNLVETKKIRYRAKKDDLPVEPETVIAEAEPQAPVKELSKGQQVLGFQKVENPYKKVPLTNFMNNDEASGEADQETEIIPDEEETEQQAESEQPGNADESTDVVMIDA